MVARKPVRGTSGILSYVVIGAALFGAQSQALAGEDWATVELFNPNQTIARPVSGSVLVPFEGSITFHDDRDVYARYPAWHLYLDSSVVNKADFFTFSRAFTQWLGGGNTVDHSHYSGVIFNMEVEATDPLGLYWHLGGTYDVPVTFYTYYGAAPEERSNEVPYSIRVVGVPEPASLGLFGAGCVLTLARRRRRG